MSAQKERVIFRHGRNGDFTEEEYFALVDKLGAAYDKGDMDEFDRIDLPVNPIVARAFKEVYGKDFLLEMDVDLTEANIQFGEDWLDAPNE